MGTSTGRGGLFFRLLFYRSVNSFGFLDSLLWFVLGPGGLREAAGGPAEPSTDRQLNETNTSQGLVNTLCYAIVLPGRKSVFRVGFRLDSSRESFNIGSPAALRPAGGLILVLSR